jgi:multidrug efflux pump subunit AcrB
VSSDPLPPRSGIIAWFACNPVAANLLMATIIVGGLLGTVAIRKEFFPEASLDSVTIRVPYLGAAPVEVEEGVCVRIEEAIQDVNGIKRITSTAAEGIGTVRVEVENGYNVKDVLDEIKVRVDAISTFPDNTEKPVILENVIESQVLWVQVYGDTDERTLREFGQRIRDEISALPGVTRALLRGARDYEISLEVSEHRLRELGLTFDEVVDAVRRSSLNLPAGSIKTAGGEVLLRSAGQAYTGAEFSDLVVRRDADGTLLRLGEVATVRDGFIDTNFYVRFDGKPAVGIQVYRVGEQNTLTIANTVHRYVEERRDTLPAGLQMAVWGDSSRLLKGRLTLMLKNGFFGGLLVLISLTLFLRLKVALWVMLGLPVCFLGAVLCMPWFDASINMITLFGFILVLGIVVDDAIVIGENVYTTVRRDGHSVANVIRGAQQVAMPATFGVLTTVAAFIPMLLIPGVNGKIWSGIAIVVVLCLLFSLVESKLILPAHLAESDLSLKPWDKMGPFSRFQRRFADGLHHFVDRRYRPLLALAVRNRYTTAALFVASFLMSIGLIAGGQIRFVFFPSVPSDFARTSLVMAEGTPASVTRTAAERIQDALWELDAEYRAETGEGFLLHVLVLSTQENSASFFAELTPSETRKIGTVDLVNRWRERVGGVAGATELRFEGTAGPGRGSAPINFQLEGNNYEQLDAAARELKDALAGFGGVFDIQDSFSAGKPEIRLQLKPAADALGIALQDLARQVRFGFYGAEAQRVQRGKDEVKVMVRYPEAERRSLSDLENMRIRTRTGGQVPFGEVAAAELGRGYSTITRIDRKRVVAVTADADKDRVEPGAVIRDVQASVLPDLLARYPEVRVKLEGESRDQDETLSSMKRNGVMALFIIFALMAVPLRSYWKPIIIMSVIPFGFVGAVIGHLILGLPISILSLCGIIALAGVVVNDSLVMVDFINQYEASGKSRRDAVLEAGPARFRAILLTSLTTFLGLFPMLLERSLQAQFLIPMAASLAFGILFATVITLFLVPSLYLILEDVRRLARRNNGERGASEDGVPVSAANSAAE